MVGDPPLEDYDTGCHEGPIHCHNPAGCSHSHQMGSTSVPPIQAHCSLLPTHYYFDVVGNDPLHQSPIVNQELVEGLGDFVSQTGPIHSAAHYRSFDVNGQSLLQR